MSAVAVPVHRQSMNRNRQAILEEFFPDEAGNAEQEGLGTTGTGRPKASLMEQLETKESHLNSQQPATDA